MWNDSAETLWTPIVSVTDHEKDFAGKKNPTPMSLYVGMCNQEYFSSSRLVHLCLFFQFPSQVRLPLSSIKVQVLRCKLTFTEDRQGVSSLTDTFHVEVWNKKELFKNKGEQSVLL